MPSNDNELTGEIQKRAAHDFISARHLEGREQAKQRFLERLEQDDCLDFLHPSKDACQALRAASKSLFYAIYDHYAHYSVMPFDRARIELEFANLRDTISRYYRTIPSSQVMELATQVYAHAKKAILPEPTLRQLAYEEEKARLPEQWRDKRGKFMAKPRDAALTNIHAQDRAAGYYQKHCAWLIGAIETDELGERLLDDLACKIRNKKCHYGYKIADVIAVAHDKLQDAYSVFRKSSEANHIEPMTEPLAIEGDSFFEKEIRRDKTNLLSLGAAVVLLEYQNKIAIDAVMAAAKLARISYRPYAPTSHQYQIIQDFNTHMDPFNRFVTEVVRSRLITPQEAVFLKKNEQRIQHYLYNFGQQQARLNTGPSL